MNYLGIDLSKRDFHAVVMDQQGLILHSHKYQNTQEDVLAVLARCPEKPAAVIEATQNWMWLVLHQWLTLLSDTQERVKDLETAIHERCRDDRRVELLQTIPGF